MKRPAKITPGRPVHYHMSLPDQTVRCPRILRCDDAELQIEATTVMPVPVAKMYFGNWDVFERVYDPTEQVDTRMTAPFETKRVAHVWGGWEHRRRRGPDDSYKTLTKIAPPAYPRSSSSGWTPSSAGYPTGRSFPGRSSISWKACRRTAGVPMSSPRRTSCR